MDIESIRIKVAKLEKLHSDFERQFPAIYGDYDRFALLEIIRRLHSISSEKLEISSALYREVGSLGRIAEEAAKELYRNEHQMKFRLEEVMGLLNRDPDYEIRVKLEAAIERLVQFHRLYDYAVRKALGELTKEVEGFGVLLESENKKNVPVGILEELRKIKVMESELETLKRFLLRLYLQPSDLYRVEEALKEWHSKGLLWVEARNVEKASGVKNAGEILEGLALIGVVEKKMRGGEGVYRHRSYSPG